MFPTAVFSYMVGSRVNANIGDNEEDYGHTLFFMRMEYWSYLLVIIGILGLALGWD